MRKKQLVEYVNALGRAIDDLSDADLKQADAIEALRVQSKTQATIIATIQAEIAKINTKITEQTEPAKAITPKATPKAPRPTASKQTTKAQK